MEANSRVEEVLDVIAKRQPPGDRWLGLWKDSPREPIEGLVPTLTAYMRATEFKGAYRLEPLEGNLFAIKTQTVTWTPPEPEKYDLYGEC